MALFSGQVRRGSGPIQPVHPMPGPSLPVIAEAHECQGLGSRAAHTSLFCLCPQRTMPAGGRCGARAASSPAPTSPRSTTTTPTARGPSWPSWGTPSPWSLLTSSWKMVTTFWKSRAPRAPHCGKHTVLPPPRSQETGAHLDAGAPQWRGLRSVAHLPHPGPTVDKFGSHRDENALHVFRAGVHFYSDFGIRFEVYP